ncbi:NfeD family protein [Rhizobacter sp. OV335]|jgi:membrane protein implicated in regulation of membrane protease activity|uniref:NfeD family protein n=1 Tax=Rhizobacter sp. OV335 TaxID=1500264 RepID=UPI0009243410|nr:NfeD family protein [Rhizobacter sp. OV335]SHN18913.1 Membrane protein implicated in regulation of membrane protease activity [Rhizobacter sp. OV335]
MSPSTFWWVAAGVAVAAELATGTFYLLMFALGLAAAALAALLGFKLPGQLVMAAVVGGGAVGLWHWRRLRQPPAGPVRENRDVNIDIGERVHVPAWADDRTARVPYRGSTWTARLAPDAPALPGEHVVQAVEGNWLVLVPSTIR